MLPKVSGLGVNQAGFFGHIHNGFLQVVELFERLLIHLGAIREIPIATAKVLQLLNILWREQVFAPFGHQALCPIASNPGKEIVVLAFKLAQYLGQPARVVDLIRAVF